MTFASFYKFFDVPHLAACIFLIFYNEPELGAEINACIALTLLPLDWDQTHDFSIVR